ncbi:hypothetical protein SLS62_008380 [Diatrype stigma]|uniref:Arrestin-like N-terminal domain-containing protein n=1 Tax=Diatrype stigma TaxID=117547 RepID=A0AAN9UVY1_9PEZI
MSIRIALDDNPPEFYTNLDFVSGRVVLSLSRPEHVGNVVVKLEGESRTALGVPPGDRRERTAIPTPRGNVVAESHKLLYKVQQVYPTDERTAAAGGGAGSTCLYPGQHEFRFRFKVPLNNICHDPKAMSSLVGIGGPGAAGGFGGPGGDGAGGGGGGGFLGFGGFRTMDGTRQLFLNHVKSTLPPSLTGFPAEAEIRYYIKVTIQRPGFFKENWRYQVGFKFLPIEPPRPPPTHQEAFARRPFVFKPRAAASPLPSPSPYHSSSSSSQKRSSFFGMGGEKADAEAEQQQQLKPPVPLPETAPSIEMSARIPHPSIITCNQPLPLRLLARKLTPFPASSPVYLTGLEIALVGYTHVRVQDLHHDEVTRWVVFAASNLHIELKFPPDDASGGGAESSDEFEIPAEGLWAGRALPNTVAPSFRTCNLARRYEIDVKLSLSWGGGSGNSSSSNGGGGGGLWGKLSGGKHSRDPPPQVIHLPLKLSRVDVFSGISPPPELLQTTTTAQLPGNKIQPPQLPPRPTGHQQQQHDPIYEPPPPPLQHQHQHQHPQQQQPGVAAAAAPPPPSPYDDAPPSYDEAMAADITAPPAQARPAYSGVTAENAPSTMPVTGDGAGGGGKS